jgi:hypothetical protein
MPIALAMRYGVFASASGSHVACQPGLDGTPRLDLATASNQSIAANHYVTSTMNMHRPVQNGHHFADIMEAEVLNVQSTMLQGITHGTVWA